MCKVIVIIYWNDINVFLFYLSLSNRARIRALKSFDMACLSLSNRAKTNKDFSQFNYIMKQPKYI